jgi:hypothetical protein
MVWIVVQGWSQSTRPRLGSLGQPTWAHVYFVVATTGGHSNGIISTFRNSNLSSVSCLPIVTCQLCRDEWKWLTDMAWKRTRSAFAYPNCQMPVRGVGGDGPTETCMNLHSQHHRPSPALRPCEGLGDNIHQQSDGSDLSDESAEISQFGIPCCCSA